MMSEPCTSCTARCCKNYDVFIDHEDLKIQSDRTFIKKIEYSKSFGYVPSFILFENESKKKWVLCLNNPNKTCQFLENNVCSIYEKRPLICKTYPHFVDGERVKTMKNLCPVKWRLSQEQEKELRQNYETLLVNFLAFETICDQWNLLVDSSKTLDDFLDFVENYKF